MHILIVLSQSKRLKHLTSYNYFLIFTYLIYLNNYYFNNLFIISSQFIHQHLIKIIFLNREQFKLNLCKNSKYTLNVLFVLSIKYEYNLFPT